MSKCKRGRSSGGQTALIDDGVCAATIADTVSLNAAIFRLSACAVRSSVAERKQVYRLLPPNSYLL